MKISTILNTNIATAVLTAALAVSAFASTPIAVTVDGNIINTDTQPQIVDGRTLVPMRAIFEALGADIEWNASDKIVTATKADTTIKMTIGANSFEKNGKTIVLDTPAMVIDNRTMVPVRAVSESLGCKVDWNNDTKTVIISSTYSSNQTSTETSTEQTTAEQPTTENTTTADWITSISAKAKRPAPISDALLDDTEMYSVHISARYNFEQSALPLGILDDKEAFSSAITNEVKFTKKIKELWVKNTNNLIMYYLTEVTQKDYSVSSSDELKKLFDKFTQKSELEFDKNVSVSTIKTNDGYMGVIGIANDLDDLCCAYIAIHYTANDGFKIYTLEADPFIDGYIVCYTNGTSRGNYGIVVDNELSETPEAFLKIIDELENE